MGAWECTKEIHWNEWRTRSMSPTTVKLREINVTAETRCLYRLMENNNLKNLKREDALGGCWVLTVCANPENCCSHVLRMHSRRCAIYLLLSILRCKWLAIRWRASLNSKCKPNLSSDAFFSTSSVISISILFPSTDDLCQFWKEKEMPFLFQNKAVEMPFALTWLVALNSSTLFAFSSAFTNVTMTGGLMKLVSTFNTRKVLVFSIASANNNAVRSFRPTLVNDNTSKCSFSGSALNNCSNFSSEIFCRQMKKQKRLEPVQLPRPGIARCYLNII